MLLNENFTLVQDNLTLSILNVKDQAALETIAQDPRIWVNNPSFTDPADFVEKWFKKALEQKEQGKRIPFVIHYQDHVVGSTSFYDIDLENKQLTIGYTWLHPDYWGTGLNTSVKHLLFDYVFTTAGFKQINFVIDILNTRSRAAVLKLGATENGIFRNHMLRPDCTMRDSICYRLFNARTT